MPDRPIVKMALNVLRKTLSFVSQSIANKPSCYRALSSGVTGNASTSQDFFKEQFSDPKFDILEKALEIVNKHGWTRESIIAGGQEAG